MTSRECITNWYSRVWDATCPNLWVSDVGFEIRVGGFAKGRLKETKSSERCKCGLTWIPIYPIQRRCGKMASNKFSFILF